MSRAVLRRPVARESSTLARVVATPYRFAKFAFEKWWVRRAVRAARVVAIGGALFGSGRQLGIVEYANDPASKEAELLEAVARGAGATRVHVCGERRASCPELQRKEGQVEPVVRRCLEAARALCAARLDAADAGSGARADAEAALARVSGAWKVVLFSTSEERPPMVNAFVSGVCPRTVFVSEGLLDVLRPTADELGFCLGHELSHLLHGHTEEKIYWRAATGCVQLAVLAFLDPSGLFAFAGAEFLQRAADLLLASHSRDHEDEADLTGLRIAASACFDARHAASFMSKLADHGGRGPASWLATHPSSDDRQARLAALARDIHAGAPEYAARCRLVRSRLPRFAFDEPRPWYRRRPTLRA